MKALIVTTAIGRRNTMVVPIVPQAGCESTAAVFTDGHTKIGSGWKQRPASCHVNIGGMASDAGPRLATKWYKMKWRHLEEAASADVIVWVDARMEVKSPHLATAAADALNKTGASMVAWPHDPGHTLESEVALLGRLMRGGDLEKLHRQAASYKAEGMNMRHPMFVGGFLAFDAKNNALHALLDGWFAQNEMHTTRDQVSLPYVCWKHGLKPGLWSTTQSGTWRSNGLYVMH